MEKLQWVEWMTAELMISPDYYTLSHLTTGKYVTICNESIMYKPDFRDCNINRLEHLLEHEQKERQISRLKKSICLKCLKKAIKMKGDDDAQRNNDI